MNVSVYFKTSCIYHVINPNFGVLMNCRLTLILIKSHYLDIWKL